METHDTKQKHYRSIYFVTTQVLSNIKKIPYIWINQHKECKIELS
jgi:hypothetical protein